MRFLAAALLVLTLAVPARAEPFTLTTAEALGLMVGLQNLDCAEKVPGPRPQCKDGARYRFSGAVLMAVARDLDALAAVARRFEDARQKAVQEMPGEAKVDEGTPEGRAALRKIEEMLAVKQQVDLVKIPEADLQLDDGAKNQIPASALSAIYPLIERKR